MIESLPNQPPSHVFVDLTSRLVGAASAMIAYRRGRLTEIDTLRIAFEEITFPVKGNRTGPVTQGDMEALLRRSIELLAPHLGLVVTRADLADDAAGGAA